MEVLWIGPDQISADEDVHNAADEGYLLPQGNDFGIIPLVAQLIYALAHAFPVSLELLICRRKSTPPFFNHALASNMGF